MQRINWFPDPLMTGKTSAEVNNGAKKDYTVADNKNWVRFTSTATGDNFGQFSLLGDRIPPAGTYHVHALAYAQKAAANFIIYSNVANLWKQLLNKPVADGHTLMVDSEITIPDGCQNLLVRMQLGEAVGLIGMMTQILIESKSTYDSGVGGASGLLLGGYDATRLRRFVGRVTRDDARKFVSDAVNRRIARYRGERFGGQKPHSEGFVLCEHVGGMFGRNGENQPRLFQLYGGDLTTNRHRVFPFRKPLVDYSGSGFGQSTSHRNRLHRLQGLRQHEKASQFAQSEQLQRKHHAPRLTLAMGVVA